MQGQNGDGKYHYCVLYTHTIRQWKVTEAFRRALPEDRGEVFYPCVELWLNGREETIIRALFPGYIFVRSDMDAVSLHEFVRERRREVLSFVKEIHLDVNRHAGDTDGPSDSPLIDLSDEEAEYLDFMLNFRSDGIDHRVEKRGTRLPEKGVLGVSYGYRDRDGCIVMEGPLRGYEDHIVNVNLRDRKAYLDFELGGHRARAGLMIRGKKYWYPQDKDALDILADGTEIDCRKVAQRMMGGD